MVKIIAGEARSLRLNSPASRTRPTSQRVREAVFSRLESLCEIPGSCVLDLFAGTGSFGLEAASRGAEKVWLVENDEGASRVLERNIKLVANRLSSPSDIRAVKSDVSKFLGGAPYEEFDILFADPPYEYDPKVTLKNLNALSRWLLPDAVLIVETSVRSSEFQLPECFESLGSRTYGETRVQWGQFTNGSQPNF